MRFAFARWSLALVFLASAYAGETTQPTTSSPAPVVFCITGDVPYKPGEEKVLAQQLKDLPEECRYLFHVGDIQPGPKAPVTEDRYKLVAGILKTSAKPVFIVPGDNEWNDAPNFDEAWTFWMGNLFKIEEHWKHGLTVTRQKERPENLAFVDSKVLFMGINLVGGRVHDAAEWKTRHAQNAQWVSQLLTQHKDDVTSAVLFAQANPGKNHEDFMTAFVEAAGKFAKPVLFIHGDGHTWIKDTPFAAKNILRIQTDMGGVAPPLKVTVTADPVSPFSFDRRLPAATSPR